MRRRVKQLLVRSLTKKDSGDFAPRKTSLPSAQSNRDGWHTVQTASGLRYYIHEPTGAAYAVPLTRSHKSRLYSAEPALGTHILLTLWAMQQLEADNIRHTWRDLLSWVMLRKLETAASARGHRTILYRYLPQIMPRILLPTLRSVKMPAILDSGQQDLAWISADDPNAAIHILPSGELKMVRKRGSVERGLVCPFSYVCVVLTQWKVIDGESCLAEDLLSGDVSGRHVELEYEELSVQLAMQRPSSSERSNQRAAAVCAKAYEQGGPFSVSAISNEYRDRSERKILALAQLVITMLPGEISRYLINDDDGTKRILDISFIDHQIQLSNFHDLFAEETAARHLRHAFSVTTAKRPPFFCVRWPRHTNMQHLDSNYIRPNSATPVTFTATVSPGWNAVETAMPCPFQITSITKDLPDFLVWAFSHTPPKTSCELWVYAPSGKVPDGYPNVMNSPYFILHDLSWTVTEEAVSEVNVCEVLCQALRDNLELSLAELNSIGWLFCSAFDDLPDKTPTAVQKLLFDLAGTSQDQQPATDESITTWLRNQHREFSDGVAIGSSMITTDKAVIPQGAVEINEKMHECHPDTSKPISTFYVKLTLGRKIIFLCTPTTYTKQPIHTPQVLTALPCCHIDDAESLAALHSRVCCLQKHYGGPGALLPAGATVRILQLSPTNDSAVPFALKGLRVVAPSVRPEPLLPLFQKNSIWAALSTHVGLVVVHPEWIGPTRNNLAIIGPSGIDGPHGFDGPVITAVAEMTQKSEAARGRAKSLQMHGACILCRTHTSDTIAVMPFRLKLDADFAPDPNPGWVRRFIHPRDSQMVVAFITEAFRDSVDRHALGFVIFRMAGHDERPSLSDQNSHLADRPAWPLEVSSHLLSDTRTHAMTDDMDILWSGIVACGMPGTGMETADILTSETKAPLVLTVVPASLGKKVRTMADWDKMRIDKLREDLVILLAAFTLRRISLHNSRMVIPYLVEDRLSDLRHAMASHFWFEWACYCDRLFDADISGVKALAKSLGWPISAKDLTSWTAAFMPMLTQILTEKRMLVVKWLYARLLGISFQDGQLGFTVPFPAREIIEQSVHGGVKRLVETFKVNVDIIRMVMPVHSRFEDQTRLTRLLALESADARNSVYSKTLPYAMLACLGSVLPILQKRQVAQLSEWAKGRHQLVSWLALVAREANAETPPLRVAENLNLMFLCLAENDVGGCLRAGEGVVALLLRMCNEECGQLPFVLVSPMLRLLYVSLSILNYSAFYSEMGEMTTMYSHLCRLTRNRLRPLDDMSASDEMSVIPALAVGPPELLPSEQGCNSIVDGTLSDFDVLAEKWVPADALRPPAAPLSDSASVCKILLYNVLAKGVGGEVLSSLRALVSHPWPLHLPLDTNTDNLTYIKDVFNRSADQTELWVVGNNAPSGCLGLGCPKTYKHDTALVEFDQTLAKENCLLQSVGEDVAIAPLPQPCLDIGAAHDVVAVACGEYHSVVRTREGCLIVVGSSRNGQLGFDAQQMQSLVCTAGSPSPVPMDRLVPFEHRLRHLHCLMGRHLLLSKKAATLHAISDEHSEASFHLPWSFLRPASITVWAATEHSKDLKPLKISQVDCSSQETLLLTSDGNLIELGTATQTVNDIRMSEPVTSISCGTLHSALLTKSGKLMLRGLNDGGQLGPLIDPPVVPETIDWARRSHESLTSSRRSSTSTEQLTTAVRVWTNLTVVAAHLDATQTPSRLLAWLQDRLRAFEATHKSSRRRSSSSKPRAHVDFWLNTEVARVFASVPAPFHALLQSSTSSPFTPLVWESVACGEAHTLALATHGGKLIMAWGQNEMGQLGANQHCMVQLNSNSDIEQCMSQLSLSPRLSPAVFAAPDAVAVRAGGTCSAMLMRDGTVSVWGANDAGNLGPQNYTGLIERPTPLVCASGLQRAVVSDAMLGLTTATTLLIQRDGTAKRLGCLFLNNRSNIWQVPRTWEFSLPRNWNALKRHFPQPAGAPTEAVPLRLAARTGSVGMNHYAIVCTRNLARPSVSLPAAAQAVEPKAPARNEDAVAELAMAGPRAMPARIAVSNLSTLPFGSSPLLPEKRQIVRPPTSPQNVTRMATAAVDRPVAVARTKESPEQPAASRSRVLQQVGVSGIQGLTLISEMLVKNLVDKGLQGVDNWLGELEEKESPVSVPVQKPSVQRRRTEAATGTKGSGRKASLPDFKETESVEPAEWSAEAWSNLAEKLASIGPGLRARRVMRETPPLQTSPEPTPSARSHRRQYADSQASGSRRRVRASSTTYVPRESSPSSGSSVRAPAVINSQMYIRPPLMMQATAVSSSQHSSSSASPTWSARRPPPPRWQPSAMPARPNNLLATNWRPTLNKRFLPPSSETVTPSTTDEKQNPIKASNVP